MSRPHFYIEIATVILHQGNPSDYDNTLQGYINPYASSFVNWALSQGVVYWLTDRPFHEQVHLAKLLRVPADAIPIRSFESSKTELIPPSHPDVIWVDCELIPGEITFLHENHYMDRFFQVPASTGVTSATKALIERKLRERAKN